MKITSPAFENNGNLPVKYTCDGGKVSPPLAWSDVPAESKSLALVVDDPDAPRGTFVHWIVWNIAPNVSEIAEGGLPQGAVEGATSVGKPGYVPACPPSGRHRYFFKIYALDTMLDLPSSADIKKLEVAMSGHILGQGELLGLYSR